MCDPVTIGGLVLSAGGMVANSAAQSQVEGARSSAMNAEMFRQGEYDRDAVNVNATARGRYANAQGDMDAKRKEVADFYKTNSSDLPTSGPTTGAIPESSSNIVVQEGKKQGAKVSAFNTQQNDASANLRSFGDFFADAGRGNARDAANLGTVNSFKKDSQSVLPLELAQANTVGNDTKFLGDILSGLGTVGTFAGLSGFNPFGGSPIATSTPASFVAPHGAKAVPAPKFTW